MCKYFISLFFYFFPAQIIFSQDSIRLAPPQTASATVYFKHSTCVSFEFSMTGAVIRYALNGEEPDEQSATYKEPICVSGSVVIKAKSFASGYFPSEAVRVQCIKSSGSIILAEGTEPEKPYDKNGLKALYDGFSGSNSFGSRWLGFKRDTVEWKIRFSKKQKFSKVHIGMQQAQAAWIFYPSKIELLSFEGKVLGLGLFSSSPEPSPDEKRVFTFPLRKKISGLIIRMYNYPSLPEWHPGRGNKPWLFVDEIAVE